MAENQNPKQVDKQNEISDATQNPNIEQTGIEQIEQFLKEVDKIDNLVKDKTLVTQTDNQNATSQTSETQNNSDTTSVSSSLSDGLKVRVVRKNSLDGDVNAGLRDPMSNGSQIRVVEKNSLETDVIASLRDPIVDYGSEENNRVLEPVRNEAPVIIKPNMSISSATVQEGSKAIFTVSFDKSATKPFDVTFSLANGTAGNDDFTTNIIVKDSKGNVISKNSNGSYSVPVGETTLKVEVQTNSDNDIEGNETFSLLGKTEFMSSNVSGIGTILDNTPVSIMSINNVVVNEGSPYAVFEVSGGANQLASLSLANQNDDGSNLSALQYFNGTNWTNYTSGNVSLDSNGKLLVRVALSPEQETAVDNGETFNLIAKNTSGVNSTGGLGTIKDDGTGSYFAENNNSKESNIPNGVVLDDDRPLTINNISVNEASPYAVFTVTGVLGQKVQLSLSNTLSTSDVDAILGTDTGNAGTEVPLQYYNGSSWVDYTTSSYVTIPNGGTTLLVRTKITNDTTYEGSETFTLIATNTGGSTATGIATIYDDGTGDIYPDNTTGAKDTTALKDDDRAITVSGIDDVSEGSNSIFTVTLPDGNINGTEISLVLNDDTTESDDYSSTFTAYYYNNENTQVSLTITDGKITLPAGFTTFYVKVPTTDDSTYEGAETFKLTATITNGNSADDTSTILDDGIGKVYDDKGTDTNATPDNDKPTLTLSDATVEEGSTIVFAGSLSKASIYAEEITLNVDFSGSNTAETTDINTTKTSWSVIYTDSNSVTQTLSVDSNGKFTLPAGITSFDVKIPTINDNVYEGAETFTLSANATSSYITDTDTAVGTIKDDGTASDGDDIDSSVDDDRTKFSIANAEAYEGASNTITFTVTRIGDAKANQTVDYAATIETGNTAEVGDFTGTLSGTLTFAPGETSKTITLNVPVDADSDEDTFTVTLSNASTGSLILDATAIGTIKESNTPPEGADKTIALGKNTTYVLSASDFGYSDANNDTFSKVKITTLETNGKLLYFNGTSWSDVEENQEITKSDIDNGYLVFKPNSNDIGVPYTTFKFSVNDGTDYDLTPNTITYNIGNTLSVSNPLPVDEGKSAIFTISLDEARNQDTLLDLTISGVDSLTDYDNTLYYKKIANDGQSWSWETIVENQVTIAQGQTSIEIRVKTLSDAVADDAESLTLTASINGGTNTDMANTTAIGSTTINDYPSLRIDTKPFITEGDFAVFEVSLSSPKATDTVVTLGGAGSATMGVDYSQNYEYSLDDGLTWQSISNFSVTIPGSSTTTPSVLIRTQTTNDGVSEPDETITLIATTTDTLISTKSVSTTTTIVDKINLTVYEKGDDLALVSQANSVTLDSTSEYIYTILGQGKNGTVIQSGNDLIYTPNDDFSGADSFTYIRTNTTTGLEVVGSANVTVNANADMPIIEISASVAVIESVVDSDAWKKGSSQGNPTNVNYNVADTTLIGQTLTNASGSKEYIMQTFEATSGMVLDLAYNTTGSGTLSVYWAILSETSVTLASSTVLQQLTYTGTVTVPTGGYNTIVFVNTGNNNTSITFNSLDFKPSVGTGNIVYDVDIYNALTDTDNETTDTVNKEELQNVTLQVKDNAGTTVLDSTGFFNQGTYDSTTNTWTFTQAQLDNLKVTVSTTLAINGFKLEATATSKELSNDSIAIKTATISIIDSDDRPTIGDKTLSVQNGSVNTTSPTNIDTDYSNDGGNVFSWDVAKSQLPELYADGQKVVITFDNVTGKVIGTIDNGNTVIFTTTINMLDNNSTTLNYTQGTQLLGVVNMIDGDIILPGGGNQPYRVFQFTKSGSDSTVVVDALVSAHNLIEDSAAELASIEPEHTVNTNNYYIGVDSNNMNAGQQLKFDFATVGTYNNITTRANEISEINIKLFNFSSGKSGDELYITVITKGNVREQILLTQDKDYTSELEYTVRSTNGDPIIGVEFLAGNNSSFKLGIQSIGSINYNDTFEMKYAYDITDVDGDSDGGVTTVTVGSGTVNTSLNYELDSRIIFDSNDKIIDGGAGIDTLVLGTGINIDFDDYTNSIKNIEKIDLTTSGANSLSNIEFQDIISITDSNNLMTILGDSTDIVSLKNTTGSWSTNNEVDNDDFKTYINSGDNSISLKIDKDIQVSII